jgi:predicted transglutaminase-like cysteine proteinase
LGVLSRISTTLQRVISTTVGIAIAGLSCAPAPAEQLVARNPSSLFGGVEIGSRNLSAFPKWLHVLRAFEEEAKNCRAHQCGDQEWQAIVASLRGRDLMTQLHETNLRINEKPYIADDINWGVADYWATPFEFLRKGGGDCEDYAIAKYMMLRELGIPKDDMRIVVLKDLRRGTDHAVLAVYIDGTPFVLDNRDSDISPANSFQSYQPVYSINEHGWWLHRPVLASSSSAMPTAASAIGAERGTFAAQLASLPTNRDAIRAKTEIQARYATLIKSADLSIRRADLGAMGTWYRVLVGPFGSRNAGAALCTQLRVATRAVDCIVISLEESH